MTLDQMKGRTKTVTRRQGWRFLKPGMVLNVVDRVMGLKRGEHPRKIGQIRITAVWREFLNQITDADVVREGFPTWNRRRFIEEFCRRFRCEPWEEVTRIEFEHLVGDELEEY